LACGLLEQLKSKSVLPTVIIFRHDVFNYFFKCKGEKSNDKGFILLNKEDFQPCCVPDKWDRVVDFIGDGVKIDFPIKLRPFLSWSPKTHRLVGGVFFPLQDIDKRSLAFQCAELHAACHKTINA
jgi:hypothetical protein